MALGSKAVKAQFADFELDLTSGELCRNGTRVRLQGQPFLVLCVLLEHANEVVTREELQRQLWPSETFVDFDHGLNKAIAKLREALDDPKIPSRLIETLPRRGYRFNAETNWIPPRISSPISKVIVVADRRLPVRQWLVGSLVLTLLIAVALWFNRSTVAERLRPRQVIHSVAVLPLTNLSNDPEQEYLAEGMTEELITDLTFAKSLRVLSYASITGFKKSQLSLPQIAEKLHVDAVIEGSVLRENNKVRINIRLTSREPDRQLWEATYEQNLSEAITLQYQIAAEAATQIRAQLAPEEKTRINLESRISPKAYDEYLRARFFLHQESDQGNKAIPHLEKAIKLDPDFAAAYAALGEAWGLQGVWGGVNNRDASKKALEYSQKAVTLDPNSSDAYGALGHSLMQCHRWSEGEAALRRALELDPNNQIAAEYLAILLVQKGHVDESVMISRELANANPVAIDFQRVYADMLYRAHQYDDAIALCQRILDLNPSHLATYSTLANALVEKGRYQEAELAFKRGKLMDPGLQAWLEVREGNFSRARQVLKNSSTPVNVHSAVARYLLGDQVTGLTELDYLANEMWSVKTYHLRNDPTFDALRNDPRFGAIVKRTGLLDN